MRSDQWFIFENVHIKKIKLEGKVVRFTLSEILPGHFFKTHTHIDIPTDNVNEKVLEILYKLENNEINVDLGFKLIAEGMNINQLKKQKSWLFRKHKV